MFDYMEYQNRSSQHILFYEAGVDDREKVYKARVGVIGLGGIALESSRLLAMAQIGLLRLVHWNAAADNEPGGIGASDQPKSPECLPRGMAAAQGLAAANPLLAFEVVDAAKSGGLEDLLEDIDLVLYEDTDREQRKRISDACRKLNKPWIYAEAHGGSGLVANVIPGKTACIDCVKSKVKPLGDGGLEYLPSVTDLIARTMSQVQAMEALRILGESPNVSPDVFCFDVDRFGHTLSIPKDQSCARCNG